MICGGHYTADWGGVWLYGRRVRSLCLQAWDVAWIERRTLSVTHSAAADAGMWLAVLSFYLLSFSYLLLKVFVCSFVSRAN